MEKASGGSFALTTRKTAEDDDEDEEDWDMTLNMYKAWAKLFLALRALESGLSENYSGREVRRDALLSAADEPAV
jgi:hypothetical protein